MAQRIKSLMTMVAAALLVFGAGASRADIANDMKDFYSSMGGNAAVEPAKLYKGQSATYGSLGGLGARAPVKNFQPLTVSMPSVKAGCGGIDAYLGGFSFVNSDQFVQYIQAIGNNAVGFAFQLAMDVISPQVSNIMKSIRDTADFAKGLNMNSCEAARNLVKGASATLGIRASYCESEAVTKGKASGQDQAKFMCQDDSFFNTTLNDSWANRDKKSADSQDPEQIFGNLIWSGLKKNGVANDTNKDLAMAIMNITGTVVTSPSATEGTDHRYIAPKLTMEALLDPKNVNMEIFSCSDPDGDCINIEPSTINPTILRNDIQAKLNSIASKITSSGNEVLTDEESALVNLTRVPIYGLLQYATDVSPVMAQSMVQQFTEYLTIHVLVRYFDVAIKSADDAMAASKMKGADLDSLRKGIATNIESSRKKVADIMAETDKKIGSQKELLDQYSYYRAQAFEKYAPDIQKRMAFSRMLSKKNRTSVAAAK